MKSASASEFLMEPCYDYYLTMEGSYIMNQGIIKNLVTSCIITLSLTLISQTALCKNNQPLSTPQIPFGSHIIPYAPGTIFPNQTQAVLDSTAASFYDQWKSKFLIQGCGPGRYYVSAPSGNTISISEGQGYGMTIVAMMAGHDPDAQTIFDGLYYFYQDHPSSKSPYLMSWEIVSDCSSGDRNTATDGDLDIALALLMADRQWGSYGNINYLQAAMNMLQAIEKYELDTKTSTVLLGSFATPSSSYWDSSRPSDFMTAHFRSFGKYLDQSVWNGVINNNYSTVSSIQTNYSPTSGLISDFVVNVPTTPAPAPANFLGDADAGHYSENACRVPWRLSLDFLLNQNAQSKALVQVMNKWVQVSTGGNPKNIMSGYSLDGNPLAGTQPHYLQFMAPFAVSAMVDASNQQWLNALWNAIVAVPVSDAYYSNTIKTLALIILSGNYWSP